MKCCYLYTRLHRVTLQQALVCTSAIVLTSNIA